MTKEEEQGQEVNILVKEIESWSNFESNLREEDRILFSKMLMNTKQKSFKKAFNTKGEY
jgi:hypothetical protein